MENWIADAVGKMYIHNITGKQVAEQMGVSPQWLSYLLKGKRSTANAAQQVNQAIDEIIEQNESREE